MDKKDILNLRHLHLNNDVSIYNHAKNPIIEIDDNGTIDILKDFGDGDKISIRKWGVIKFIKAWLQVSGHELFKEEVDELLNLLINTKYINNKKYKYKISCKETDEF